MVIEDVYFNRRQVDCKKKNMLYPGSRGLKIENMPRNGLFLDDFWYFEPHMPHEKIRYSPISLWMYEIRLRVTVNVYFKYNYYIQFQRKKGMNMHKRHFGHRQNPKKIEMVLNIKKTYRENEFFFEKMKFFRKMWFLDDFLHFRASYAPWNNEIFTHIFVNA